MRFLKLFNRQGGWILKGRGPGPPFHTLEKFRQCLKSTKPTQVIGAPLNKAKERASTPGAWTEMLPFEHDLPNPPPLEPFSECFFTELDFDGKTPVGSATIEYFQFTYDPATGDVTTGFAPGNTRSEQNETIIKAVQQKFCYAEKLHL